MLVQPSVQSATQVATFVNSTTATGVEQPVVRSSITPVDESKSDASAQNSTQRFQVPRERAAASTTTSEQSAAKGNQTTAGTEEEKTANSAKTATSQELRQQQADQVVIEQLKARDREVRVHEAAHAAAGGQHAGAPSLQFTRGPDGKNYATGGEVSINTSPVSGDPQATIAKARVIRAAALAPAEPSSQDRRVAASAAQMEAQAHIDLRALEAKEQAVAEQARTEKLEAEQARKKAEEEKEGEALVVEEEGAADRPQAEKSEPIPVVQVSVPAAQDTEKEDVSDQEEDAAAEEPRPNARQQLEKILLGSRGLLADANNMGLVDPRHPFGESGYLNVLA